jgi:hypothetical protein
LFDTIHDLLTEDEEQRLGVNIACIPSCDGDQTSSALVEFKGGHPKFVPHPTVSGSSKPTVQR